MNHRQFIKSLQATYKKAVDTSRKKNKDYTSGRSPFFNFNKAEQIGVAVEKSIFIRFQDKVSRLETFMNGREFLVEDEQIEDTLLDAINYLAILKAYLESKK